MTTEVSAVAAPPALRISGLRKAFGPTLALRGADLLVRPATVHGLLGGNGSGKSTLVKILAGVHQADDGAIALHGRSMPAKSYKVEDGRELRFIHQDLGLVETMTVAENMGFANGFPRSPGGKINWRSLRRRTTELLERYEIDTTADTVIGALRPADRTMVAIARALGDGDDTAQRILVLDEPTASLPRHEAELLLAAVRRRAALGQTVVLISHHLREVLDIADEITVLRDGSTAGTLDRDEASEPKILALMAGRTVAALARDAEPIDIGAATLRVRGLAAGPLEGIDLDVAAGEIIGVTGLLGSGRSSLVKAIFGDLPHRSGTIEIAGRALRGASPSAAMAAGVALVPEDRAGEAAFADHTVSDNMSAAVVSRYWRTGRMARRAERRDADGLIERFGVRAPGSWAPLTALSGGNQQKTVLARWLRREPRVLLLDEPTQGVDVVSRADIYRLVREAAAQGCAVVVASSDVEEISVLCHRVLVLAEGEIAAEVDRDQLDPDVLVALMQSASQPSLAGSTGLGTGAAV